MSDKEYGHHGNTPAAWTMSGLIILATLIGTIAVCIGNWLLFWIGGVALLVVAGIVGLVMSSMGYGKRLEPVDAHSA